MGRQRAVEFETLYAELAPRVLRLGFQLTSDRSLAEDVVQETFLAVYRGLAGFRGDADVSTWVYRIAVNEARRVRRRAVRAGRVAPDVDGDATSKDSTEGDSIDPAALYRAIAGLSDDQREALSLLSVRGVSAAVASAVLGVPEGTVYSRAHAARLRLRSLLEDDRVD